ncbi:MAG TPA: hypothetical protein DEF47_13030 [Herpetosiphon sp.]|nr:hypothetical protein [Herpetosiphon sp.]HBW50814.1 hypothetical protein [Herpetosiphon sp.]
MDVVVNRPYLPALVLYMRYNPDPQPHELWLYDPQMQTHTQIEYTNPDYVFNGMSQALIDPNL